MRLYTTVFICLMSAQIFSQSPLETLEDMELQGIATRRDIHFHYDLNLLVQNALGEVGGRLEQMFGLTYCHPFWQVSKTEVYKVGFNFSLHSGYRTLGEARTLLKNVAYEILLALDKDPLLRPYLAVYPAPPCILELSIRFFPDGCNTYPFPGNVAVVSLSDDRIKYDSASPYYPYFMKYFVEELTLPPRY